MDPEPIKVLLIEDNAGDAGLLRAMLSKSSEVSFELAWAERLSQGLEQLAAEPDVVLLDLNLPDSSGRETFRAAQAAAPHVPIIVLSGLSDESLAVGVVQEGAQDYLVKGQVDRPLLVRSIRYAIERRRSQETLAQERSLLRNLIDSLPDHIYVKDTESRFLNVNLVTAKFFGAQSPEQVVGKTDFDFFSKDLATQFRAEEVALLESGLPCVNREIAVTDAAGNTRWVLTTKVPLHNGKGQVFGLIGVNRDITEIKKAQEESNRLASHVRLLMESTAVGIFGLDSAGLCTFINKAGAAMLGYEPAELLGKNLHGTLHHSHANGAPYPIEECPILRAIRSGEGCRVDAEVFWRRNGTGFPVEYMSYPIREHEAIHGAVVTFADITQRKGAEHALEHERSLLRALFDNVPDYIFVKDAHGRYLLDNVAHCHSLGKQSSEEVVGKTAADFFPKEQAKQIEQEDLTVLHTGHRVIDHEQAQTNPDGRQLWVSVTKVPLRDADGRITGLVGLSRDITERKRAEEEYHTIISTCADGFFTADAEGRLLDVNEAYCQLVGYTREELLKMRIPDLEASETADETAAHIRRVAETGRDRFMTRHRCKNGRIVDVEISVTYRPVAGGRLYIFARDMTEHRRADRRREAEHGVARVLAEALTAEEATPKILQVICENIGWAAGELWVVDPKSDLLRCTYVWHAPSVPMKKLETAVMALAMRRGVGLPGRVWAERAPVWVPDISKEKDFPHAPAVRKAGLHAAAGFPIRVRNEILGVMVFFSYEVSPPDEELLRMFVAVGSQIGLFIERRHAGDELLRTLADLTKAHEELKTTHSHLIEVEKMDTVGRLAAGVAHEVKNPLAMIRMGIDYITGALREEKGDVKLILADMTTALMRADAVVGGLLDLASARELSLQAVDLHDTLEQCLTMLRHTATRAHVHFVREFAEHLPQLLLDRMKTEQVFINLILNGIQAMPEGGTLTLRTYTRQIAPGETIPEPGDRSGVRLRAGDTVVVVEIDDTGGGVPPDKLAKVFDPFYTTKSTGKGTGLGLTVSRKIIETHGGTISIANRPEGGARVTVMLKT